MSMLSVIAGNTVTVPLVLLNGDTPFAATALEFKLRAPDGTVTTWVKGTDDEIVTDSTGNYHIDVTLTSSGRWAWQWRVDDAAKVVLEGEIFATPSVVA